MSKDKKSKDGESRKIKQVYLSEEGEEIRSKSEKTEKKEKAEKPEKSEKTDKTEHHHGEVSEGTKAVRIIAVAVAMLFSLVLAMGGGTYLALWDEGRTVADLQKALFAQEVSAATVDDSLDDEEVYNTAPDAGEDEPVPEEVIEDDEPEDYGSTISSDTEGLENVSKAGEGDEIVATDDSATPLAIADPMSGYPLPFTTVDESYFTDALFIGDSRLQGFGFWSGLPATYYCATGFQLYKYETAKVVQTENGKVPIFDAMPYDAFTKIYIKVGLNELGFGTEENFEKYYAQLIAKLREYEPRAIIYVHGILPVTAQKSASDKAHNNPNILVRNAALEQFAKTQKAYYLDAGPAVSDEEGNLRPEMTSDGIHLKPEHMKVWRDYLCEHAIVIE